MYEREERASFFLFFFPGGRKSKGKGTGRKGSRGSSGWVVGDEIEVCMP